MRCTLIISVLCAGYICTPGTSFAQESNQSSWGFLVSGGFGVPLGAYRATDATNSVISGSGYASFNGFQKRGNAAAQVGTAWSGELIRRFASNWAMSLIVASTSNHVTTRTIDAYLNSKLNIGGTNANYTIHQRGYHVLFYEVGLMKYRDANNYFLGCGGAVGLGVMNYPLYELNVYIDETGFSYPVYHIGFTPNSSSFTMELRAEAGYKITRHLIASVGVKFRCANFLYEAGLRPVGGSSAYLFIDKINYRQLIPSLNLSYHL